MLEGPGSRKRATIGGEHGSYRGYYGQRRDWSLDNRVQYLKDNVTELSDVASWLDIGCNEGLLTIALAKKFKCISMTGIDIDQELIRRAEFNRDASIKEERCSTDVKGAGERPFESIINFICGDVLQESQRPPGQYAVVSCFSVTKWIHLNHGDPGIVDLFAGFYSMLRPAGLLILEAQPWKSYQKRRRLNDVFSANIRAIQIRPANFQTQLEELGFELVLASQSVKAKTLGFSRSIHVYRKRA